MSKVNNFQDEFPFDDIVIAEGIRKTANCGMSRIALCAPEQISRYHCNLTGNKGRDSALLVKTTLKLHYAFQVWCKAMQVFSQENKKMFLDDSFYYWDLQWERTDGPFNNIEAKYDDSPQMRKTLDKFWSTLRQIANSGEIQVSEGYQVGIENGQTVCRVVLKSTDIPVSDIYTHPYNTRLRTFKWRDIKPFFVELTLNQLRLTKPHKLHNHTALDDVLLAACSMLDEALIKQTIARGANINCLDNEGQSAMQRVVDNYLFYGTDDDEYGLVQPKPTDEERQQRCQQIVDLLLSYGADINLFGFGGNTPLETAVKYDEIEMVKFLLERGASPNVNTDYEDVYDWQVQRNVRSSILDSYEQRLHYEYDKEVDEIAKIIRAAGGRQYVWDYTPWNEENVGRYVVQMKPSEYRRDIFTDNSDRTIGTSNQLTIEDQDGNQTVINLDGLADDLSQWNADYRNNRANHDYDWLAWKQHGRELADRVAQVLPDTVALYYLYDNDQVVEKYDAIDHVYLVREVYLCCTGGPLRIK